MALPAVPLSQLRIVTDKLTGEIYLVRTSHKDRNKIVDKHKVTDEVTVAMIQYLCHTHSRDETSFSTIRMQSGNYRIYIREVSDIEADRFYEQHSALEERYGER
ncbi:hypothetical protein CJ666_22340 [Salmonella enterica]|nr:hypothetical protein [Salmonella enterica]